MTESFGVEGVSLIFVVCERSEGSEKETLFLTFIGACLDPEADLDVCGCFQHVEIGASLSSFPEEEMDDAGDGGAFELAVDT